MNDENKISITHSILGVENGQGITDSQDYNDIPKEQQAEIISLLKHYKYQRRWDTLFSSGHLSKVGSDVITLSFYDRSSDLYSITILREDLIIISDKVYTIKGSDELICKLLDILNTVK